MLLEKGGQGSRVRKKPVQSLVKLREMMSPSWSVPILLSSVSKLQHPPCSLNTLRTSLFYNICSCFMLCPNFYFYFFANLLHELFSYVLLIYAHMSTNQRGLFWLPYLKHQAFTRTAFSVSFAVIPFPLHNNSWFFIYSVSHSVVYSSLWFYGI